MTDQVKIDTKVGDFHLKINLLISSGINCLYGPSGSGKTSIVNCIAGLTKPKKALIQINDKVLKNSQDQVVRNLNPKEIKRILFQTPVELIEAI